MLSEYFFVTKIVVLAVSFRKKHC